MVDPTLPLLGLSPVAGKQIVARFDGGRLSGSTVHTLSDIVRFRLLMIAAGLRRRQSSTRSSSA
jgi:hypothetical protein